MGGMKSSFVECIPSISAMSGSYCLLRGLSELAQEMVVPAIPVLQPQTSADHRYREGSTPNSCALEFELSVRVFPCSGLCDFGGLVARTADPGSWPRKSCTLQGSEGDSTLDALARVPWECALVGLP